MRSERRDIRRSAQNMLNDQVGDEDTSGSGGDPELLAHNPLFSSSSFGRRRNAHLSRLPARNLALNPFKNLATSPPTDGDSPAFPLAMYSASDDNSDSSDDDDDDILYHNPSLLSRARRTLSPTIPPYIDARPTIKTYFKIYSPSKGGRMLSIYESAPDRFNFSQSWGWKSSTLMLDEVTLSGSDEGVERKMLRGEGKLRFMIVIGNL
jgi:hypothetical protein